jgi:hypothetical protein
MLEAIKLADQANCDSVVFSLYTLDTKGSKEVSNPEEFFQNTKVVNTVIFEIIEKWINPAKELPWYSDHTTVIVLRKGLPPIYTKQHFSMSTDPSLWKAHTVTDPNRNLGKDFMLI